MPPSKEQILESLGRIPAPDGRPLPQTGTLSEIVVSDEELAAVRMRRAAFHGEWN